MENITNRLSILIHSSRLLITALLVQSVVWLALLQGCMVGPDYDPPEVSMPDAWTEAIKGDVSEGGQNLKNWWAALNDPMLDGLIQRAAAANLDLKEAFARIMEARARRGIAAGEIFPELNAEGSYSRERPSGHGLTKFAPGKGPKETNLSRLGLGTTWEVDVFGRIRRNIESADASMQASIEDYRDVLVILYAEVALNYVDVRKYQARLKSARANVETQKGTLKLTKDRLKAGLAPKLDVAQAERNLATTESEIPPLETHLMIAINRLGVLLGQHPGELHKELTKPGDIPGPPKQIAVSVPVNILRRRPDIRSAERMLAAQTAQIGVATAYLYPRLTLTGSFSFEATNTNKIFNRNSVTYGFGPSVLWNVFDGGRIRSNILAQKALTKQALYRYEQTVLMALEEVENAIVAFNRERVRRDALRKAETASKQVVALVMTLYKQGLTDFQNVLDAERSLFELQDQLFTSDGQVTKNLIILYKALGGGWSSDDVDAAEPRAENVDAKEVENELQDADKNADNPDRQTEQ